jgi:chemotaxis regulatin CheY-phosphate phosphatase CheZ
MADFKSNRELHEKLSDLHRGLHVAMTEMMTNKNLEEAEIVLRQIDERLKGLIKSTKVVL